MARQRKRKETVSATTPAPEIGDAYEPPAADESAELVEFPPKEEMPKAANENEPAKAGVAKRAADKVRSIMGRYFPKRKVELVDDFNGGGLGVKLSYDDPNERPSEAVKQILKAEEGKNTKYSFRGDLKQWRKAIGRDAEPRTAIAIRMDAERRFEAVGDQMSHEERLRAAQDASQGQERQPG